MGYTVYRNGKQSDELKLFEFPHPVKWKQLLTGGEMMTRKVIDETIFTKSILDNVGCLVNRAFRSHFYIFRC